MKKAYIIHGWEGFPDEGWFPWLAQELTNLGIKVFVPQMPNAMAPTLDDWIKALSKIIGRPNKDKVLIGHSLGCPAILHYLDKINLSEQKFKAVILVAPFVRDINIEEIKDFVDKELNWKKIRRKAQHFMIIHSRDDLIVPIKESKYIVGKLDAKMIELDGYQHFSGSEGITKVSAILDVFKTI